MIDLDIRAKSINTLRKTRIGINLQDPELGKTFLDMRSTTQERKETINKSDVIKIKNF